MSTIGNTVDPQSTKKVGEKIFSFVIRWGRRLTAAVVNFLFFKWLFAGLSPSAQLHSWLDPLLTKIESVPPEQSMTVVVLIWYVFLSRFKIRWFVGLPIYFFIFIPLMILLVSFYLASDRIKTYALSQGYAKPNISTDAPVSGGTQNPATSTTPSPKTRRFPKKRAWFLLFVLWLLAFRGLQLPIATWLPPMLVFPIWMEVIRFAYRCAMAPRTFARALLVVTEGLITSQINALKKSPVEGYSESLAKFARDMTERVLKRYSADGVLPAIQREAMLFFFATLFVALGISTLFWALVGIAINTNYPDSFSNYTYFSANSLFEAILWAWACMTTSIDYPTATSPLFIRVLHVSILTTGILQLTFLLAGFSIMSSAESERVVSKVQKHLDGAREKLTEISALEDARTKAIIVMPEEHSSPLELPNSSSTSGDSENITPPA